ncbi:hypothetical protein JNE38_00580 [Brevibacillus choshinensis]|uniref:Uncharacterized protein n=2 Tax=Brevibacillus choshinensis TaxID=54911 RepID=A0ABX7FX69_BRECH|nr:hypothetical protein JNE38_00580 [Brevibacillus choshinensis]
MECGIQLIPFEIEKGAFHSEADGWLLTKSRDMKTWGEMAQEAAVSPGLLLVYGEEIPYGWTESVTDRGSSLGSWEVVRMALLSEKEKALVGGKPDGEWLRMVCRLLARYQRVSLVCSIREVDEILRQLPMYLSWKERFYLELGERCDQEGISLQTVSRALGMDKRIGQGWLYPNRLDQAPLCRWIEREGKLAMEKANVHRVVLWGSAIMWNQMDTSWLTGKEVCLLSQEEKQIPNEVFTEYWQCEQWQKALQNADLLVIGTADDIIRELPLKELVHSMKQANVVDACACFPVQETQNVLQSYRAIGEKTNVWE